MSSFFRYRIVEFAFSARFRWDRPEHKEKIVQDAFRGELPAELYNRPKGDLKFLYYNGSGQI